MNIYIIWLQAFSISCPSLEKMKQMRATVRTVPHVDVFHSLLASLSCVVSSCAFERKRRNEWQFFFFLERKNIPEKDIFVIFLLGISFPPSVTSNRTNSGEDPKREGIPKSNYQNLDFTTRGRYAWGGTRCRRRSNTGKPDFYRLLFGYASKVNCAIYAFSTLYSREGGGRLIDINHVFQLSEIHL